MIIIYTVIKPHIIVKLVSKTYYNDSLENLVMKI
jgi:hypothetical protein